MTDSELLDLFSDVITKLRFEPLTRAQQHEQLMRIVAAERERCARVADGAQNLPNDSQAFANGWCSAALQIAQAIRKGGPR